METNLARRAFLKSAPVALASAAVPAVPAFAASVASVTASPALVAAHGRLKAALREQRDAKDALEWIADEWRHLWPLAPEDLLQGANAERSPWRDAAERDIIGNFIHRDTSDLTNRLSAKFRRETPKACFGILTSEEAQKTVEAWTQREPKGRTEKARAYEQARREKCIQEYSHKVNMAKRYEAETQSLRNAAGVGKARERILQAERQVSSACHDISKIPAINLKDMVIKGEALMTDGLIEVCKDQTGILGEVARFIRDTVELGGAA